MVSPSAIFLMMRSQTPGGDLSLDKEGGGVSRDCQFSIHAATLDGGSLDTLSSSVNVTHGREKLKEE